MFWTRPCVKSMNSFGRHIIWVFSRIDVRIFLKNLKNLQLFRFRSSSNLLFLVETPHPSFLSLARFLFEMENKFEICLFFQSNLFSCRSPLARLLFRLAARSVSILRNPLPKTNALFDMSWLFLFSPLLCSRRLQCPSCSQSTLPPLSLSQPPTHPYIHTHIHTHTSSFCVQRGSCKLAKSICTQARWYTTTDRLPYQKPALISFLIMGNEEKVVLKEFHPG